MSSKKKSEQEKEALRLPPMSRGMQLFSMVLIFLFGVLLTWFVVANPFGLGFLPDRTHAASTAMDHEG